MPRFGARRVAVLAVTGILGVSGAAIGSMTVRDARLDAAPESVAHGKEVHHFGDLATMAVTADLVVEAHVTSVAPGRTIGGERRASKRLREVRLAVDLVLYDARGAAPAHVVLDEEGWDASGQGYMFEGVTWSSVGQRGFYFLTQVPGTGTYRLVSSQGRLLQTLTGGLDSTDGGEFGDRLERMSPGEVRDAVRAAEQDLDAGRISAQPRP